MLRRFDKSFLVGEEAGAWWLLFRGRFRYFLVRMIGYSLSWGFYLMLIGVKFYCGYCFRFRVEFFVRFEFGSGGGVWEVFLGFRIGFRLF